MKAPCLHCQKRYAGCHSQCHSYIKFKKELELIHNKRNEDSEYLDYITKTVLRMKKYR